MTLQALHAHQALALKFNQNLSGQWGPSQSTG
jgi:hypothetical protein